MPVRPLALAALLLLVPVPAVAQPLAETGPATVMENPTEFRAEPPADDPGVEDPATGAPDGGEVPADTAAPQNPDAGDGATTPPDGPSAPATTPDDGSVTGSEPSETEAGATGQPPAQDSAETTGPAGAEAVDPQRSGLLGAVVSEDAGGAGVLPAPQPRPHGAPTDEGSQVVPGTVDRISLGALTRVPAQDSSWTSALPSAGWGLVVSALAAGSAAALLLHRRRAGRARR